VLGNSELELGTAKLWTCEENNKKINNNNNKTENEIRK
jgi:hypothetical protein